MTVYEADIPGVGRKFELELNGEERLVVVIHHNGKRELYHRPSENEDSVQLASLSGKQARQLGSILEGAYFQPVEMDDLQVPLGESIIEWVDIDDDTPIIGGSLRESGIRSQTGTSIIAVQRGKETYANPGPDFEIESDDILVAIGTREQQAELEALAQPDSADS
jgi:TrkA domain protein